MEQSTLQDILAVEQALREELDAERRAASDWLENARLEIERDHQAGLEALRREAEHTDELARQGAVASMSAAVDQPGSGLDTHAPTDDELRRRLRPHLAALVPEPARAR